MADSTRETVEIEWANAADPSNIYAPLEAKQNAGFGAEKPSFRWVNWFWKLVTNLLISNEKNGILPWRSLTSYNQYGLCMGSNGKIYQSVSAANLNHDPVTDSTGTYWKVWVGQAYDEQYVELTSGTLPLTNNSTGTYTYNISDFVGPGLKTSEIRRIHVLIAAQESAIGDELFYSKTSGSIERLRWKSGGSAINEVLNSGFDIPINRNEATVTIRLTSNSTLTNFTIIGATQRVFNA